jgi:hypothetical protein
MASEYQHRREYENALHENKHGAFEVAGFSYPAGEKVNFLADFAYSSGGNVNWRERLVCPITGLNNRIRAAVHLMDSELGFCRMNQYILQNMLLHCMIFLPSNILALLVVNILEIPFLEGLATVVGLEMKTLQDLLSRMNHLMQYFHSTALSICRILPPE